MFSGIIAQICETIAGLFPGPLAFVGDLMGQVCGPIVSLLEGVGL
jgi:hypothetical protein